MLNYDELPLNERKGAFGVIYLRAIAAVAGYGASIPESDYDSIDLIISSRKGKRHRLEFQAKCTSQPVLTGNDFGFELSRKNYDDLRADSIIPRLLFVLLAPEDTKDWVRQSERRMNLRRCGYWLSLRGAEDRPDSSSVTVRIPRSNVLTPEALQALMVQGVSQ